MPKAEITLGSSQRAISQMAAQIYAAYITRGLVKDGDQTSWMRRSIREAARIAKTVSVSIRPADQATSRHNSATGRRKVSASSSRRVSRAEAKARPAAEARHSDPEEIQFDEIVEEALSGQ
jgi:hypothetical protein